MYAVERVGADGAPTLFGPFRVEQSARDFANRPGPEARVVELRQPILKVSNA